MNWVMTKLRFLSHLIIFFISGLILVAVFLAASLMTLPNVDTLKTCIVTTLYKVHLCPGSENYVNLHDISPYVLHAVIAAEDGTFYSHKGFDWHEIKQSMNANMHAGGFRRGGSTLTQQLAKNVFLGSEKSLWRKAKEAYLAHAIERRFDKNFILEKYLNVVEFGPNIFGVKAAAQHYFQKSPAQLHPLESAYLAMLLPNPKKYSQSSRAGRLTPYAQKMVSVILQRMKSFGKLSASAYQTAMTAMGGFPWSDISIKSFADSPTYSLDSDVMPAVIEAPIDTDDGSVQEIIEKAEGPVKFKTAPPSDLEQPAATAPAEEAPSSTQDEPIDEPESSEESNASEVL